MWAAVPKTRMSEIDRALTHSLGFPENHPGTIGLARGNVDTR